MTQPTSRRRKDGFTLMELLVVIGIITLLLTILIPVVSRIRGTARNAATAAFVASIQRAIDVYYGEFRAYPGPLKNDEIYVQTGSSFPPPSTVTVNSGDARWNAPVKYETPSSNNALIQNITMSENLVLGLMGGLVRVSAAVEYQPWVIDNASGLTTIGTGTVRKFKPFMENAGTNLSWRVTEDKDATSRPLPLGTIAAGSRTGQFADAAGWAKDSIIPEFVDSDSDPMPILYLRAKVGAMASAGALLDSNNSIVTYDLTDARRTGQYDLHQIIAYTDSPIGAGKKLKREMKGWASPPPSHGLVATTANKIDVLDTMQEGISGLKYYYPFAAYPYFRNPALSTPKEDSSNYASATTASLRNDVPRQKDAYILIAAGQDRIYGTEDDITNFGEVAK